MRAGLLLLLSLPTAAVAATLRPAGTLSGPMVHVSDLWDGAGAAGARVLGPGPAPGGNIIVGAGQLGAIARAYGVDWQPQSDGDQAVLSRPGTPLPFETVADALRPALVAQRAGGDAASFDLAMPMYDAPVLDAAGPPRLHVEQLSLDTPSGSFTATLRVEVGDAAPMRLRVTGTLEPTVMAMVPTHRLQAGVVIEAADLATQRVRASLINAPIAVDPAQVVGLQLRHVAVPGQPLPLADLEHPIVVKKNDRVMIGLALPGLDLGAVGEAMAAGAVGDTIGVRNPVSGMLLSGRVIGPDQVRVNADSPPATSSPNPGVALAAR